MTDTVPAELHSLPRQTDSPGGPFKGDLTEGPILQTMLVVTVPTLISNVLQTLNGSINAVWVGRLLGEGALAATANANVIMFLLFAAVFALGVGLAAVGGAGAAPHHGG